MQTYCLATAWGGDAEVRVQVYVDKTLAGALLLLKASHERSVGLGEGTQARLAQNVLSSSPHLLHLHFLICKAEMNRTNLSAEDCEDLQIKALNTYD